MPLLANTVTLRPLRQRSLHLPAANIRVAMNRGAFDFLTKPIDFGDLETTIVRTIRHVEAMRESRRRQSEAERAHASLCDIFLQTSLFGSRAK